MPLDPEIDRLRRALERERAAANAFRSVARNSRDRVATLDRDLRVTSINRLTPPLKFEEVIGASILDFLDESLRPHALEVFERVARTHETGWFESESRHEQRGERYWDIVVGPLLEGEALVGFTLDARDITDQRRERAAQNRFFLLSLDMLCVANFEGFFIRVNPSFTRILGYEAEELAARPILSFVHPDDQTRTIDAFEALFAGEAVLDFENRYRRRDGSVRWISWRATSDLERREIYAVARDVTEQKALEAQLRQSQRLEAVGQLAGGLAHDFRNMVLAIEAHLGFLRAEGTRPAAEEESIARIETATARARDLSRRLLTVAEVGPSERTVFDASRHARVVLDLIAGLVPSSIEVVIEREREAITRVSGDPGQIEQVFLNMVLNARDAMPEGGRITIRFSRAPESLSGDPWLRIVVRDEGRGMEPDERERAFDPFFTTKERGTGLGLSTVAAIVQQHEGRIEVESEGGRGTTFTIDLPTTTAAIPIARPRKKSREVPSLCGNETILVAEDEELVREVLARVLAHAGYRVIFARDGREALALHREYGAAIDLVVLDHIMPGKTGAEVLARLRADGSDVPVLLASGQRVDPTAGDPSIAPDGFLRKPFDPPELLSRVRQLLDQRSAGRSSEAEPEARSNGASGV